MRFGERYSVYSEMLFSSGFFFLRDLVIIPVLDSKSYPLLCILFHTGGVS